MQLRRIGREWTGLIRNGLAVSPGPVGPVVSYARGAAPPVGCDCGRPVGERRGEGQARTRPASGCGRACRLRHIRGTRFDFPASVLLGLVIRLSGFWSSNVPEYDVLVEDGSVATRRQVVVGAVAAVLS
jgi:hypothetical protein